MSLATIALSIAQHVRLRRDRMLVGLWVATCVIPLLGLVGTIAGFTTAFDSVSSSSADQRAAMLAEGISEAMNATALGLALFALFLASTIVATVRTRRASPPGPLLQAGGEGSGRSGQEMRSASS
ncbi:MAG: MotA/TolQ/ExbB proton channel family protein [Proteobacteria bacterium]|jgi:biopolymer transport protein ExbB/TolQ|nr:MotA/TolQ/ExbB proton channel family protein [Pseudomonadota bacterium]